MARNISIENTRFIFKTNLSGDPARDTYGSTTRYANVVIPTKAQADDLAEQGFNVRCTKPKAGEEEGFEPTFFVKAVLKYHEGEDDGRDPKVYLVSGHSVPKLLNADTVGMIDDTYVVGVNCMLNPYYNKRNDKWSLYISVMYVEQDVDEDPFAVRYSKNVAAESADEFEMPFN